MREVKRGQVIVNLADTYIKGLKYENLDNSLLISNDFMDEDRWAIVETSDSRIVKFSNKKRVQGDSLYVICGLYAFSNVEHFENFNVKNEDIQIVDLLEYYHSEVNEIDIIKTNSWLDFGHIDKYYISKKKLIQARSFNSLEYDDLLGTITKRSENRAKFIAEIRWQLNLPKSIQVLAPRVLEYSLDENPFITMEFYSYPTLAEIWLFSELNEKIYYSIVNKLFKVLELFSRNIRDVSKDDYKEIYKNKTLTRIAQIENQSILRLMENDSIRINGELFKNWKIVEETIFSLLDTLYKKEDNCFLHGDLCLSNILYDLRSGIFKLIDPRGTWGNGKDGDIKYDVAKLRQSICGDYDYIVNDFFEVSVNSEGVNYLIYVSDKEKVKEYFDQTLIKCYELKQIKLIEGLQFFSMIPLHSDNRNRQILMYCKAIELFNQVLDGA